MRIRVRRLLLEIAAFLVVGTALLAGAAIWKLSSGPVSLNFLTSTVEEALNPPSGSVRVTIERTELTWGGWDRAIDLVGRNVTVSDGRGERILSLPKVAVGLSLAGVSEGFVRVTSVDLLGPDILLVRRADGSFAFAVNPPELTPDPPESGAYDPGAKPEVEQALVPAPIVEELASPPNADRRYGALRRVILSDARVLFINRVNGRFWHGDGINAIVARDVDGLEATASGRLVLAEGTTEATARLSHRYGGESFELSASLRGLPVRALRRIDSDLAEFLPDAQKAAVDADLTIDRQGRATRAAVRVDTPHAALSVSADGLPAASPDRDGAVTGEIEVTRLEPARIAAAVPRLEALSAVDMPLSGRGSFVLTPAGRLSRASLSLSGSKGLLDLPQVYSDPRVLYGLDAELAVERGADGAYAVRLERAEADLGEAKLSATGRARVLSQGTIAGRLEAVLSDFPMQRLGRYWPQGVAQGARDWVVPNIARGHVERARIETDFTASGAALEEAGAQQGEAAGPVFAVTDMAGEIAFRDAQVDYLAPLTPAEGVAGTARFDGERFDVEVTAGTVDDIAIEGARVEITGLKTPDHVIAIDLDVNAPLPTALRLLDTEPYGYVSELGLEAGAIDGRAKANVTFEFPLLRDLRGDQVRFVAAAQLRDVRVPRPELDLVATAPTLELWVDNNGLDMSGPVSLNGLRTVLTWRENFDSTVETVRHLTLKGRPRARQLARFGLDLGDIVTGEMAVDVDYKVGQDRAQSIRLFADIGKARVALRPLDWAKPRGRPGTLDMAARIGEGGIIAVPHFRLEARDTAGDNPGEAFLAELSFEALPNFEGLAAARLERLSYGTTDVSGTLGRREDGVYVVDVSGRSFDVSGLIGDALSAEESVEPEPEAEEKGPAVRLTARLDRLRDGPDRSIRDAVVDLRYDGETVTALDLNGRVGTDGRVEIAYGPPDRQEGTAGAAVADRVAGARTLRVRSDDAGGALRSLDWTDRIRGGTLRIDGERADREAPISGHATIDDFTLLRAPVLAKLLEFMSLTGVLSALTDSGLAFEKMEGDFTFDDGRLALSNTRAYGSAIGITAKGSYDLTRDRTDIEGTIAPMYSINRVIDAIPIIGDILTGREGVFAANYSVSGPIGDPEVSVNPLSVLAPGFLRNLFGGLPEGRAAPPPTSGEDR